MDSVLAIVCIVLLAATFTSGKIIRSMVADSKISFDVINFFTLNIYSVTGFIVLCCIAIGYFLFSQIFVIPDSATCFQKTYCGLYLAIAIGGLGLFNFSAQYCKCRVSNCLSWSGLLIYLLLLNRENLTLSVNKISSSRLIFWLFFFSLTITGCYCFGKQQKRIA